MTKDTETLLQDVLARCAREAATCLANGATSSLDRRTLEMRMAASLVQASARLADSLARMKKQTPKRGSIGKADGTADGPA